jgi:hypothetical protein
LFRNTFWSVYRAVDESAKQRRRAHLTSVRARLKLQQRVEQLEEDLARMGLVSFALAKLCVDKGVVTREELEARMLEIDLSDGVEDGKAAPEATGLGAGDSA